MEIFGADIKGIEGQLIKFDATKDDGKSSVTLLGLAKKVVKEGFVRAAKAIETLDGDWGSILNEQGYTIQLSPPEDPKTSSGLDLPIAIMLLQASILQNLDTLEEEIKRLEEDVKEIATRKNKEHLMAGILNSIKTQRERVLKYRKRLKTNRNKYLLIGTLNIVTGDLEAPKYGMFGMISCAKPGFRIILPEASEIHGSVVSKGKQGITAYKAKDLQEVWNLLLGVQTPRKVKYETKKIRRRKLTGYIPDLKAIDGVMLAKRAMMVALAGGHNILLVGPPGQGKSMLSKASTQLLPDMTHGEMFDVNKIYSAKGELEGNEIIIDRPFQQASNVTEAALFGGGVRPPVPGLVSLAHNGILLFDEINLIAGKLIEQLRNILNDKVHKVQRLNGTLEYPCDFIMVAAMNPCKCGWFGHYVCSECNDIFFTDEKGCPKHSKIYLKNKCTCNRMEIVRFHDKLSQPLLDRIDLKVFLSPYDLDDGGFKYASQTIRRRIQFTRNIQRKRYHKEIFGNYNASVPDRSQFEKSTPKLQSNIIDFTSSIYHTFNLTKRMEVKLLLVSRTIADLENSHYIRVKDIKEAIDLMGIEHPYFQS